MKPSSSSEPMRILIVDFETTMADPCEKRSASNPYYEGNRVVAFGAKFVDEDDVYMSYHEWDDVLKFVHDTSVPPILLVGHNIKFDLGYVRKSFDNGKEYRAYLDAHPIWDTQIAQYILSGQLDKFASLGNTAVARGLGGKAGLTFLAPEGAAGHHEVPLLKYLERDLKLTEQVALQQMQEATDEQFDLIIQMGEALKACEEMEFNGMHIDIEVMIDNLAVIGIQQQTMIEEMNSWLHQPDLIADKPEWYNSNQALSAIMFGGDIHYIKKEASGIFKSGKRVGQVKFSNEKMVVSMAGIIEPHAVGAEKTKIKSKSGHPVYKVDEDVIDRVLKNVIMAAGEVELLENILSMRAANKVCNTYYVNLITMQLDGIIHHTLNQTATATGRLSSSKPNLQNIPGAGDSVELDVKKCFTSRYGPDGIIMEVDFKQLEVCALAWLTKDPNLIVDVCNGVDIHTVIAKEVGLDPTDKKQRTDVKRIVFAMIYGAGSKGIAKTSGLGEALVKSVMAAFYYRYHTIKDFYDKRSKEIEARPRYDILTRDKEGNPCPMFEWDSPTGRKYLYTQDKHRPGPSYTQNRNYPVQGTATADIVPVVIAEVAHVLRNANLEAVMVTTTHDSITFDCKDKEESRALQLILNVDVFDRVGEVINTRIPTIDWDIPLIVEWEAGPSWGEMKGLDKYGY